MDTGGRESFYAGQPWDTRLRRFVLKWSWVIWAYAVIYTRRGYAWLRGVGA